MDPMIPTRQILIDHLKGVLYSMRACADMERQLSHQRHKNTAYTRVIEDLEILLNTEQIMLKRIQTLGR